jgi:hypothetical protein
MSHWQSGKISLSSSIGLMVRALQTVQPEWDGHIQISEDKNLTAYGYDGKPDEAKYNLLIAGVKNPNYKPAPKNVYGDMALSHNEDDTWEIKGDFSGTGIPNFEKALAYAVSTLKVQAIANAEGHRQTADFKKGQKRVIRMIAPVDKKYKI